MNTASFGHKKIQKLVLLSFLGALIFVLKMALAAFPNIELVSLLIIVYTLHFSYEALIPIYLYVLLEFFFWGLGLWSICYLYVWLVLFFLTCLFRRMKSALSWAILSGFFGLSFGFLSAFVYLAIGGLTTAVSWWIAGLYWDIVHGIGNFCITLVLFHPMMRVMSLLDKP